MNENAITSETINLYEDSQTLQVARLMHLGQSLDFDEKEIYNLYHLARDPDISSPLLPSSTCGNDDKERIKSQLDLKIRVLSQKGCSFTELYAPLWQQYKLAPNPTMAMKLMTYALTQGDKKEQLETSQRLLAVDSRFFVLLPVKLRLTLVKLLLAENLCSALFSLLREALDHSIATPFEQLVYLVLKLTELGSDAAYHDYKQHQIVIDLAVKEAKNYQFIQAGTLLYQIAQAALRHCDLKIASQCMQQLLDDKVYVAQGEEFFAELKESQVFSQNLSQKLLQGDFSARIAFVRKLLSSQLDQYSQLEITVINDILDLMTSMDMSDAVHLSDLTNTYLRYFSLAQRLPAIYNYFCRQILKFEAPAKELAFWFPFVRKEFAILYRDSHEFKYLLGVSFIHLSLLKSGGDDELLVKGVSLVNYSGRRLQRTQPKFPSDKLFDYDVIRRTLGKEMIRNEHLLIHKDSFLLDKLALLSGPEHLDEEHMSRLLTAGECSPSLFPFVVRSVRAKQEEELQLLASRYNATKIFLSNRQIADYFQKSLCKADFFAVHNSMMVGQLRGVLHPYLQKILAFSSQHYRWLTCAGKARDSILKGIEIGSPKKVSLITTVFELQQEIFQLLNVHAKVTPACQHEVHPKDISSYSVILDELMGESRPDYQAFQDLGIGGIRVIKIGGYTHLMWEIAYRFGFFLFQLQKEHFVHHLSEALQESQSSFARLTLVQKRDLLALKSLVLTFDTEELHETLMVFIARIALLVHGNPHRAMQELYAVAAPLYLIKQLETWILLGDFSAFRLENGSNYLAALSEDLQKIPFSS